MIIWVGSLIFGGKKGAVQLIILDRAAYNPALTLTHHLREGAAAGNPLHASAFKCRLMGIFEPLYIYIFSVQLNAIERRWTRFLWPYSQLLIFGSFNWTHFWTLNKNWTRWVCSILVQFVFLLSNWDFLGKKVCPVYFLCHWEKNPSLPCKLANLHRPK